MIHPRPKPSTYEVLKKHGVDRRSFLQFCTATTAALGLECSMVPKVVAAMEKKPRIPVIWLHGLECTCCSESFIRSSHPIAQDIVLNKRRELSHRAPSCRRAKWRRNGVLDGHGIRHALRSIENLETHHVAAVVVVQDDTGLILIAFRDRRVA
jgi:hypothetical protein